MVEQASEIQERLRALVETALNLDESAGLQFETALFNGDLGLDSVDLVSLIVAVERHFGLEFGPDTDFNRHFSCIGSIASHIGELRQEQVNHVALP